MLEIGIFAYWRKEYMCVEDRNIRMYVGERNICTSKKGIYASVLKIGVYVC